MTYSTGSDGVNDTPDNQGSALVSYDLQLDDGLGGDFTSVQGYDLNSLATLHRDERRRHTEGTPSQVQVPSKERGRLGTVLR